MNNQTKIQKRIELLKSGFKKYITTRKIPMNAETKWNVEIISLPVDFKPPEGFMKNPQTKIELKGKYYNIQKLQDFCQKLNQTKITWIQVMKD